MTTMPPRSAGARSRARWLCGDRVAELPRKAEDAEGTRFGLALHAGEVMYGNIGGGNRLDFTCIGPAVNLAARLEKVAAKLGETIVASAAFARHFPGELVTPRRIPRGRFRCTANRLRFPAVIGAQSACLFRGAT